MKQKPMIARAVIRRKPMQGAAVLMSASMFAFGMLAGAGAMRMQSDPPPKPTPRASAQPVRAAFEPIDPFEGAGSIRIDRSSFCRQVATEALLSMKPEFMARSIRIHRNNQRRGEVLEQFAETMGLAIERVWCGETSPQQNAASE